MVHGIDTAFSDLNLVSLLDQPSRFLNFLATEAAPHNADEDVVRPTNH